jgi:hypothetical protein
MRPAAISEPNPRPTRGSMQQYTIKVFPKTHEIVLLRFLSPEGNLIGERELSLPDIERFAADVERQYRVFSYDPMAELPALGRRLYEWLDGLLGGRRRAPARLRDRGGDDHRVSAPPSDRALRRGER